MKKITAIFLTLFISLFSLFSCGEGADGEKLGTGWSPYAENRDVSDRRVHYVEMCVEDYGKVIILLDETTAPITVRNFLTLVEDGFYDGLYFHRIVKNFMIQGGDPKGNGTGDSGKNIKGEFSDNGYDNDISHFRGVISMARGEEADSASCQFFICNADARASLDGSYAAFGYVIMGMSVIDEITENVFPKTLLAEYYNNFSYDPYYGVPYHYLWSYYGNGAIEKNRDKPVIKYIKVLKDYTPDFDYTKGNND
jgi:peptidyl-prolyl cis-trans isomerase B (cyclophilin B)